MGNEAWINRQTRTPEARRRYEEERLILWTAEVIAEAMAEAGLTRAAVAEALGTSRANVTQLLSGSRNMTLRSLAALAHACGKRAEVRIEAPHESALVPLAEETIRIRHAPACDLSDIEIDKHATAQEWRTQTEHPGLARALAAQGTMQG